MRIIAEYDLVGPSLCQLPQLAICRLSNFLPSFRHHLPDYEAKKRCGQAWEASQRRAQAQGELQRHFHFTDCPLSPSALPPCSLSGVSRSFDLSRMPSCPLRRWPTPRGKDRRSAGASST